MDGLLELGVNGPTLLAQIINFGLLFVLLYFTAYKPILRLLDKRSEKIKESMEQAEAIKAQSAGAEEEIKKQMDAAGKEVQARLNRATQLGDELKHKADAHAQKEAEILLERARHEIQQERDEVIGEIRREFADLAIAAAEKVIDKSLDKKAHQALIDKVLEDSSSLK
ncbi:F0F1 ATP synthase subunit B [Chloroflexota bacterium]